MTKLDKYNGIDVGSIADRIKMTRQPLGSFLKGICYSPFPHGYNPSTCNDTCIFFGSDIAAYNMKPLWGGSFAPKGGPDAGKVFKGREDIKKLAALGVNLIRLYDWDSRNDHIDFLDCCWENAIQVLVPVSNYNLGAFGNPPPMDESIRGLISSFSKSGTSSGKDYHPAIYGVIFGSETDLCSEAVQEYMLEYTQRWVEIEDKEFKTFRKIAIGNPISFATSGPGWSGEYPCFGFLDKIMPYLKANGKILQRLMICPHTYNDAAYLYNNAQGSGKGWVDLCFERYAVPILFCEIGCDRLVPNYENFLTLQLEDSLTYAALNGDKLLGISYFQYCDKVWMPNTSEGSFGLVSNTEGCTDIVQYGSEDFDHCVPVGRNELRIQIVSENPALDILKKTYLNV